MENLRLLIVQMRRRLEKDIKHSIEIQRQTMRGVWGKLESLSPLSILQRGYSITRELPSLKILRDAVYVREGDKVEIRLFRGTLLCGVEKIDRS